MRRLAIAFLTVGLLAAVPALAQEEPPARVGRVSFVSGELGFHLAGETAWSAAKANYAVATGGSFWTDPKSRAELRVGSRSIAMSGNTELDVAKLDQQVMQLAVPQGRINLRVRTLLEGESIEIDLPRGAVWILQPGIYDIDAGAGDQPERIAVFEGSARFVGGTLDVAINAGDAAVISGTQTLTAATERAAPDDFSKWCRSRDYDERRLAAPYHVSPQMTGYEELDEYGSWRAVPQYGEVWFPRRVAAGWAPYREGHWVWLDPWGWSWVDDEPWGFAPFHYGRWATIEDQWAWVPGEFVPQPVYAPALVAFVGDPGTGYWNAADVGPAVGWFPLGPGEVYWPSYTRNRDYIRNINIANVGRAVIDPIASAAGRGTADPPPQVRDQRFTNRNATTVVPARIFANAAPVAPAAQQMPRPVVQQAAQQVPVSVRPPQLAPASARAQARPTGPGAAGAPGPRGTAQAPTPAITGAPGGPRAPGAPVAGPPINAAPGIAHGPGGAPGGPGPHETAHAPPAAPGVANAPPSAAAARGPHAAPGVANAPPVAAPPGGAAPHEAAHAPPAVVGPHPAPGLANAPPPAAARGSHPAPSVANAPPASPPAAAPQSARGPARMGPAQAAREPPPPTVHGPMRVGPPPQAAHVPPPAPRPAPPQMQQAPRMPPPQAVHAAPPPAPHPAPPPPQVVHAAPPAPPPYAAPAPPPQVFRPPPPPQAPHPAPPPQVAHAPAPPPPAAARPAGPPGAPPGKGGPPPKGKPPGPEEKH